VLVVVVVVAEEPRRDDSNVVVVITVQPWEIDCIMLVDVVGIHVGIRQMVNVDFIMEVAVVVAVDAPMFLTVDDTTRAMVTNRSLQQRRQWEKLTLW
jgi:hypothetical protein